MRPIAQPLVPVLAVWAALAYPATAATRVAALQSLADLSLEQLSTIPVTSVSGREEPLQDAAASVFVITAQDIRRSAATSLPEVLRLAPNLQVAQVNAGVWAISARGANTAIANKLLVLLDGRTIYSTLFAGVIWDMHDVVLEDVERIEVVSGPGGTLWGANAVNGVINIVTRRATDTQGALVSVTRSPDGGRETVRWGTRIGDAAVRVYGLATDTDNTVRTSGAARDDARSRRQAGFRADWGTATEGFTLQGDIHRAGEGTASRDSPFHHGGNLLARWATRLPDGSPLRLQAHSDLAERDEVTALRNRSRTDAVEFAHEPQLGWGRQLLWGGGVRRATDFNTPSALLLSPQERRLSWANLFVQVQQPLAERWQLTAGVKAERNSYTGLEWLPNLRLSWQHDAGNTSWAALSRAVRAPSRIDRDIFVPSRPPFVIAGGPNFQSEVVNVAELGHRGRIGARGSYAATLFRHDIRGLRAGVPGQVPATVQNLVDGSNTGIEAWGTWHVSPVWQISAGAMAQRIRLHYRNGLGTQTSFPDLGNDPRHQASLRSLWTFGRGGEFDVAVRHVGKLPNPAVPAYTAVDLRLSYQVSPTLTLSLLGQNLLDKRHVEFDSAPAPSQIERRVYLQAVWTL